MIWNCYSLAPALLILTLALKFYNPIEDEGIGFVGVTVAMDIKMEPWTAAPVVTSM